MLCNSGGLTEVPIKLLPATVEHLSLTRNHFPIIKSDAFAGLRALKKLSLDGNNISIIKPFAFRSLPRLKELSIQQTPLATVAQFAFAGLQNITSIILSHNRIAKVEGYAFAGTSNLKHLVSMNTILLCTAFEPLYCCSAFQSKYLIAWVRVVHEETLFVNWRDFHFSEISVVTISVCKASDAGISVASEHFKRGYRLHC